MLGIEENIIKLFEKLIKYKNYKFFFIKHNSLINANSKPCWIKKTIESITCNRLLKEEKKYVLKFLFKISFQINILKHSKIMTTLIITYRDISGLLGGNAELVVSKISKILLDS